MTVTLQIENEYDQDRILPFRDNEIDSTVN